MLLTLSPARPASGFLTLRKEPPASSQGSGSTSGLILPQAPLGGKQGPGIERTDPPWPPQAAGCLCLPPQQPSCRPQTGWSRPPCFLLLPLGLGNPFPAQVGSVVGWDNPPCTQSAVVKLSIWLMVGEMNPTPVPSGQALLSVLFKLYPGSGRGWCTRAVTGPPCILTEEVNRKWGH